LWIGGWRAFSICLPYFMLVRALNLVDRVPSQAGMNDSKRRQ
jgi:hypothetical protein